MNSRVWIGIALLLLFSSGCSKLELEDQLPEAGSLTVNTIKTSLPVLDITVKPGLFTEISRRYSEKLPILCTVDFYNPSRDSVFTNRKAILEIKGSSSASYPMKSLGFRFFEALDNSDGAIIKPVKVMEGDHLDQLYTFRLRNSGNDFGRTMIKDLAYTQMAIECELDLELMYGRPIQVFVNGNYYGLMNLRTESDRAGLAGLLNSELSEITTVKMGHPHDDIEYDEGNMEWGLHFEKVVENLNKEELGDLINIDNFIDYILYEDYVGNTDWPLNNVRAYSQGENPFRFFLFDLDYAGYRTKNALLPELEYLDENVAEIYQAFYDDEDFTNKLENRQKTLYAEYFRVSRFNAIVDKFASRIEDEIPYMISKYEEFPGTLYWYGELEKLKREFEKRDAYVRKKYKLD